MVVIYYLERANYKVWKYHLNNSSSSETSAPSFRYFPSLKLQH